MGVHAALTSRLKIMSGMNIVEKRRPQDGQFSTVIDGKEVDVRVASVATVFGEKIVMRILDKSRSMIGLAELGFPRETYLHYSKMIHSPFGMVICAGPTGAGKTTTLYASLLEVNSAGKNITTVEDPVEYVFPGINQIQTNDQAGLTFATGLKAILRQDPDVILVGEIRDADTARIAVQSALTGHLVLSSLARHRQRGRTAPLPRHGHRGLPHRLLGGRRHRPASAAPRLRLAARSRTPPAPTSWPSSARTAAAARRASSTAAPAATSAPAPATATASVCTNCCASRPSCAA